MCKRDRNNTGNDKGEREREREKRRERGINGQKSNKWRDDRKKSMRESDMAMGKVDMDKM